MCTAPLLKLEQEGNKISSMNRVPCLCFYLIKISLQEIVQTKMSKDYHSSYRKVI